MEFQAGRSSAVPIFTISRSCVSSLIALSATDTSLTNVAMVSQPKLLTQQSSLSSPPIPSFEFLQIDVPHDGVCHCALNRPPVNAINTAVWTELLALLDHLEMNLYPARIRVLLITSSATRRIFSAGNDIKELFVPYTTEKQFHKFWEISTSFLTRLYTTPLVVITALRGATPAAGVAIALCSDQRLALNDAIIGLNEVAIGLAVPRYWGRLLVRTATSRAIAERMLATGEMISATQALKLGIIDQIVEGHPEDLNHEAIKIAQQWAKTPGASGRAETKRHVRADFAAQWLDHVNDEKRHAWHILSQPETVKRLGDVLKNAAKRAARM